MAIPLRRSLISLKNGNFRKQLQNVIFRNSERPTTTGLRTASSQVFSRKDKYRVSANQRPRTSRSMQSSATSDSLVVSPDNIIGSLHDDISIPDIPLMEFIFSLMDSHPQDSTAMVDGPTGRTYTYAQLRLSIIKVASALTKLGYKKGDTVCIFSPNLPEFSIAFMAVAAIGGTVTTANPLYSARELSLQIQHSQAKAVITIGVFADLVKEACVSQPSVQEIIAMGEAEGCRPFISLLEDDGTAFPENVDINPQRDILVLPYSSGTTGLPKGVMLSHRNVVSNILQSGNSVDMQAGGSWIAILPFFHIYGMVLVQFGSLRDGCSLVTLPKFDPLEFLRVMEKHKVNMAPIVPPIALFLSKHPSVSNYDLSSLELIVSGAAPLGETLQYELAERLNVPNIIQGYGLTEASPVTHVDTLPPMYGTIGTCVANTEAKVIDTETGKLLGPGQEGELCVRGPQVMMGYLNNPEATQDTIRDGWLHTGDICHYDENGYFTVADRLKELIKYKGFQVPPAELEALLISHPDIADAAVIGVPDDHAGELPRAYIVLAKDSSISESDITDFVEGHVSPHKRLRGGIQFIEEIPKSASGKILRRVLKESL